MRKAEDLNIIRQCWSGKQGIRSDGIVRTAVSDKEKVILFMFLITRLWEEKKPKLTLIQYVLMELKEVK